MSLLCRLFLSMGMAYSTQEVVNDKNIVCAQILALHTCICTMYSTLTRICAHTHTEHIIIILHYKVLKLVGHFEYLCHTGQYPYT